MPKTTIYNARLLDEEAFAALTEEAKELYLDDLPEYQLSESDDFPLWVEIAPHSSSFRWD